MVVGRFLAGIFALIWDPSQEKYLILQRSEEKDHAAGMWECVTGRVDQGEGFSEALQREAREELGVDIRYQFMLGSLHFYRGAKLPEYEMLGMVCFCTLEEADHIRISAEHSQFRWVTVAEMESLYAAEPRQMRFIYTLIQRAELVRHKLPMDAQGYLGELGMEITMD